MTDSARDLRLIVFDMDGTLIDSQHLIVDAMHGAFTLAGWLEPTASIAGDTFDFSLARDVLHLSLTDAMGHGVGAALTATLCVGSLRSERSTGAVNLSVT